MNNLWNAIAKENPSERPHPSRVECALLGHPQVAEAVVVPIYLAHGQALSAFIKLKEGSPNSEELKRELAEYIREQIGASAVPDNIHFGSSLPKTRSGKIMRDILTEMAESYCQQH